jgi:hypothetical protein
VKIKSGTVAVAKKVHVLSGARLTINSGGRLTVDGAPGTSSGVMVSGSLDVRGYLTVKNIYSGYGIQVSGSAYATIHHYGIVHISDITSMGIWNDGDITNRGRLFIENTSSNGILNYSMFHNDGGKMSLLNIGGPAIYGYSSGYLINSGQISVKGAQSAIIVAPNGYATNEADGEIYASYLNSSAIVTSNNLNSLFENFGIVKANWSIGSYGLSNAGRTINHESGEITLDNAQFGIYNFVNSSLRNEGAIIVGANISNTGIRNDSEIENLPCGRITIGERLFNCSSCTIDNQGWIYNYAQDILNYGTFNNEGVIEDDPNTLGIVVSNNGIAAPPQTGIVQAGQPVYNALSLGSLANHTVGGWYTSQSLTTLAGEYDAFQNSWKPYSSSVGLNEVFVVITHNNSGCSEVISIDIPNSIQPFSAPDIFGTLSSNTPTTNTRLMAYPNPSNGPFNLKIPQGVQGEYQLQLIHPTGQMIWQQTIESGDERHLNVQPTTALANGMYQLILLQEGRVIGQDQICIIK